MTDSFTLTSCLTNDGRYKCPHCPADFAGSSGLWYHFKHNHTGQRVHDGRRQYKSDPSEPRHKCELCDATFAGISGLWYHMKHSHKSAPKNLHSVKTETRMPRKSVRVGVGSLEGANLNQVIERYSRLLKNRQHELETAANMLDEEVAAQNMTFKTMGEWVATRKQSWRRLRRRNFFTKKHEISESTVSTVLGALRFLLREKVIDWSHLGYAQSEQSLARIIEDTIKKRYGLFCGNATEIRKRINLAKEEEEREKQRAASKPPYAPLGAFILYMESRPSGSVPSRVEVDLAVEEWKALGDGQKEQYHQGAKADRCRYERELEEWKQGKDFSGAKAPDAASVMRTVKISPAKVEAPVPAVNGKREKDSGTETDTESETDDDSGEKDTDDGKDNHIISLVSAGGTGKFVDKKFRARAEREAREKTEEMERQKKDKRELTLLEMDLQFLGKPPAVGNAPTTFVRSGFCAPSTVKLASEIAEERSTAVVRSFVYSVCDTALKDDLKERLNQLKIANKCVQEKKNSMSSMHQILEEIHGPQYDPATQAIAAVVNDLVNEFDNQTMSADTRTLVSSEAILAQYTMDLRRDYPSGSYKFQIWLDRKAGTGRSGGVRRKGLGQPVRRGIYRKNRAPAEKAKVPRDLARSLTLHRLIHKYGILESGKGVFSCKFKGMVEVADLTVDGTIVYHDNIEGPLTFKSPSAFTLFVKRKKNPTKRADEGWRSIVYRDGKTLMELRATLLQSLKLSKKRKSTTTDRSIKRRKVENAAALEPVQHNEEGSCEDFGDLTVSEEDDDEFMEGTLDL